MSSSVTINFNVQRFIENSETANRRAIFAMSNQVLMDSNQLCPFGEGDLQGSAINNSDLENGIIKWVTPYAPYLYYGLLMVAPNGSAWAKLGERKHVKVPNVPLNFSAPEAIDTQNHMVDRAGNLHDVTDETENLRQSMDRAGQSAVTFGDLLKSNIASEFITEALSKITDGIKDFIGKGVELASDLQEVKNVVGATFGDGAAKIYEWSDAAEWVNF